MTTAAYATPHAAEFPRRSAILLQLLVGAIRKIVEGVQTRRAERELMTLSERSLRDIGLTRSEIPRAVRGQFHT